MGNKQNSYKIHLIFIFLFIMVIDVAGAQPFAYITNHDGYDVSLIDLDTNNVTDVINVGVEPIGVAVNSVGTRVYIANYASGTVSVIDTTTKSVIDTIYIGYNVWGIAVNRDGSNLYVTSPTRNTVSVIDTATNSIINTVDVGTYPCGVLVNADMTKIYVANHFDSTLTVIEAASGTVVDTISVGNSPLGVAGNSEGTKVYVANYNDNTVSVLDTDTDTVVATINVGNQPYGITVSQDSTMIFVSNYNNSEVSIIDAATNSVTDAITVGYHPHGISINPEGTKVYVANEDGTFSVIDIATKNVTNIMTAGKNPIAFGQFIAPSNYISLNPPVANFSSNIVEGYLPLSVQFIDLSEGTPNEWYWNFGDGEYSGLQNPIHTYFEEGNYTVILEVSNPDGNNNTTKTDYIKVKPASSVKLTSLTLDPEDSTGAATNAPGAWTTSLVDPLAQIAVKNDNGILLNQMTSETFLGDISIPLAPGINNFTLLGDNIFAGNEYYGAVLFFDGIPTPPQIAVYNSNCGTGNFSVQTEDTKVIGSANGGLFFDAAPGTSVYTAPDGTKVEVLSFFIDSINGTTDEISLGDVGENGIPDTIAKLSLKITPPSGTPVANFSTIPDSGTAPLTVRFADSSKGRPTSWYWDFGDGTTDSSNTAPDHVYTAPGNYNVSLTVANANGTDSKSATIIVLEEKPLPVLPTANVDSNITSGYAPLSVRLVSLLENATEVNWDFGDGNNSFAELTLDHLFTSPGTYNVSVNTKNRNGTDSKLVTINVLKLPELPVGNFEGNTTSGSAPLTVEFTDPLDNMTERNWDFGDGKGSTEQNPVHTYNKPGKYTVTLTARNIVGTNTLTKYNYIYVGNGISGPATAFSAAPTSGSAPLNVSFTDSSTGSPALWKWNFGDGTSSSEQNPTHTYTKAGQYTVTLTTTNAVGSNTLAKYSYVNAINVEKAPVTAFSVFPASGNVPLNVVFTDSSTGSPTSWKWNFGDGSSSTEQSPVHAYNKTGKFNVSLTAKNSAGSNTITKSGFITVSKTT